jgi:hypothetical protein
LALVISACQLFSVSAFALVISAFGFGDFSFQLSAFQLFSFYPGNFCFLLSQFQLWLGDFSFCSGSFSISVCGPVVPFLLSVFQISALAW